MFCDLAVDVVIDDGERLGNRVRPCLIRSRVRIGASVTVTSRVRGPSGSQIVIRRRLKYADLFLRHRSVLPFRYTARSGEQQRLYFFPLPHGHGAFAEIFGEARRTVSPARG